MNLNLKPVPPGDRALFSRLLIGLADCPTCRMSDVRVFNPHGEAGDSSENFFEGHRNGKGERDCIASKKPFGELETLGT